MPPEVLEGGGSPLLLPPHFFDPCLPVAITIVGDLTSHWRVNHKPVLLPTCIFQQTNGGTDDLQRRNILTAVVYPVQRESDTKIHFCCQIYSYSCTPIHCRYKLLLWFLADRTIGRAYGTVCRLSVCRLSVCLSVCDVLYCGKTVRPSQLEIRSMERGICPIAPLALRLTLYSLSGSRV